MLGEDSDEKVAVVFCGPATVVDYLQSTLELPNSGLKRCEMCISIKRTCPCNGEGIDYVTQASLSETAS